MLPEFRVFPVAPSLIMAFIRLYKRFLTGNLIVAIKSAQASGQIIKDTFLMKRVESDLCSQTFCVMVMMDARTVQLFSFLSPKDDEETY
jgi:hypothetical protein